MSLLVEPDQLNLVYDSSDGRLRTEQDLGGVGTKGVSQNHLLSFDDNKVLKLSIGYAKHLFKCTES